MVQTIVLYTELIPVILAIIALLHVGQLYRNSRRSSDRAASILAAIACCILIIVKLSSWWSTHIQHESINFIAARAWTLFDTIVMMMIMIRTTREHNDSQTHM